MCRLKGCAPQKRAYYFRLFISGASHVVWLTIDAPEVNNPKGFCGVAANGDENRGHAYKALESAGPEANELHCISRSLNRIPGKCSTYKSKNFRCLMLKVVHSVLLLPPLYRTRRIVLGPQPNSPLIAHGHRNFPDGR